MELAELWGDSGQHHLLNPLGMGTEPAVTTRGEMTPFLTGPTVCQLPLNYQQPLA